MNSKQHYENIITGLRLFEAEIQHDKRMAEEEVKHMSRRLQEIAESIKFVTSLYATIGELENDNTH